VEIPINAVAPEISVSQSISWLLFGAKNIEPGTYNTGGQLQGYALGNL